MPASNPASPPTRTAAPRLQQAEPAARPRLASSDYSCRCRRSVRAARGCRLLRGLVLCDNCFEPRIILQQALAGQDQKVVAELWVLKVDLEQLLIGYGQHLRVLGAFDRRRPLVIGREEAEFAHQLSRRQFDAEIGNQEFPGHGQEHLVGCVAFFHQNIALAILSLGHERFEPFHRRIALGCATRLLDQNEHLTKAKGIDGNHQEIQKKSRDVSGQRAVAGEKYTADHVRHPQRHHGVGQKGRDKEDRANQGKHVGEGDVVQQNFQKAIEYRIVGNIVGIETYLNHDLGDPQIVRRGVKDAV
jgi:hypothetical protein